MIAAIEIKRIVSQVSKYEEVCLIGLYVTVMKTSRAKWQKPQRTMTFFMIEVAY